MNSENDPSTAISWRIIEAIAAFNGREPTDGEPLYEVIDLDALDAFAATANCPWTVQFTYEDTHVAVHDGDRIRVGSGTER